MQNQDPLKGPFFKGLLQDAAPEPHKSSNSLVVRKAHGAMLVSTHFHHTVGGCEILHHQTDAWNILKPYKLWINGMFTTYRCRTSQPSFFLCPVKGEANLELRIESPIHMKMSHTWEEKLLATWAKCQCRRQSQQLLIAVIWSGRPFAWKRYIDIYIYSNIVTKRYLE